MKLNGPRFRLNLFWWNDRKQTYRGKASGGFDAYPFMFQFGYQFETQYLNEGNLQALFEFVPLISGVDQGLFIPSLTILHELRNNRNGWEFALGPSINLSLEAEESNRQHWFAVAAGKTIRSARLNKYSG